MEPKIFYVSSWVDGYHAPPLDTEGADFFSRTDSVTFDPGHTIRVPHQVFQIVRRSSNHTHESTHGRKHIKILWRAGALLRYFLWNQQRPKNSPYRQQWERKNIHSQYHVGEGHLRNRTGHHSKGHQNIFFGTGTRPEPEFGQKENLRYR